MTISDKVELLSKLQELLDKGTITQSEFDKMKSEMMAENEESDERKCEVTGVLNDHEYVDLGLPSGTKWATCNVGATKPTESGYYFAWGETKPKEVYSWETYKWCENKKVDEWGFLKDFTKYCTDSEYGIVDNKTVLDAEDDAATANWGSAWRMPTLDEIKELIEGCDWKWVEDFNGSGVIGQLGTSKSNGATIFLPAAGYRFTTDLLDVGYYGYYLSSSLSEDYPYNADYLSFYDGGIFWNSDDRDYGQSVRAVLR